MLFRRQIQLGLVKGSRNTETTEKTEPVDYNQLAGIAFKVVAGYVALDTIRKIAVNRLSK